MPRYFSSVEGQLVHRLGAHSKVGAAPLLGATITGTPAEMSARPSEVVEPTISWDTDTIHTVSDAELQGVGVARGYDRLVKRGALKERTAAEHAAWLKDQHEKAKKAADDAAEAARKAAEKPTDSTPAA